MKLSRFRMEKFRQKQVQDWRTQQFQLTRQCHQEKMNAESMKAEALKLIERFEIEDLEEINVIKFYLEANKRMNGGAQLNLDILSNQFTKMWVNMTYHMNQCYDVFEFINLYCHQSSAFFEEFIRSYFYFEMINNLDRGDNTFKIKILELVNSMNDIRRHEISTIKLYDCLNNHIRELKASGNVQDEVGHLIKQLILILVNCQLNLRQEQQLICLLNNYILLLTQNQKAFTLDQELIVYIHFISTRKSIFDEKTFELLIALSFDSDEIVQSHEKAAAIGVIGQLMAGCHRQVVYYYESLSKSSDLFHMLLISLQQETQIVKSSAAYAIANILKDKEFPLNELYNKGCIKQLLSIMDEQWSLEVQVELLRACDFLINHSELPQLIQLITECDLIGLIAKIDHIQIYTLIYTCLYDLLIRFEQHSNEVQQQLLQIYRKQKIPEIITKIYDALPLNLCATQLEYLYDTLFIQQQLL